MTERDILLKTIEHLNELLALKIAELGRYKTLTTPEIVPLKASEGLKNKATPRKNPKSKIKLEYNSNKKFSTAHYQALWEHFCQMNSDRVEKEENRIELEDYISERDKEIDKQALRKGFSFIEVLQRAYYTRLNELIRLGHNYLNKIPVADFPEGWDLNTWDYTDKNFDRQFQEHLKKEAV